MTRRWRRAQRRLARARIERDGQLRNSLAAVGTPRVLAHSEMPSGKGVVTLSYSFGNVEVRVAQRQLLIDGRPAAVGGRAFDILLTLIERCDRAVPKDC
jgi:DNA-binding response OmpR family regulator